MKKLLLLLTVTLLLGCNPFQKDSSVIYLVGDSTMAEKQADRRPETGWGEILPGYFEEGIKFDNRAKNGRSSKSFFYEGLWDEVKKTLKKGDYVFIQFGHNDESEKKGKRYSTPEEFENNLIKYVEETRAVEAYPVLLTPVMRRRFDEKGQFYDTHGVYPDITRKVAREHKVPLIDMHQKSETVLVQAGEEESKSLFLFVEKGENPNYPDGKEDNTHFCEKGARIMAGLAADGIREAKLPIRRYLKKP